MTWPTPPTAVARRVRDAHTYARTIFGVQAEPEARPAWGWEGRTLGLPVTAPTGSSMWLRIATRNTAEGENPFWTGTVEAHHLIPGSVPRPRLRRWHDWTDRRADSVWAYRAELYDRATAMISTTPVVATPPALPTTWWAELRSTLNTIATVPTLRRTVHSGFLRWAVLHYLGVDLAPPDESIWTTAHGDLHYANLAGPQLQVIDWEGWGRAPSGYDAAMLHLHSLEAPDTADRVRRELAHLLGTETGRRTELFVIAELLHNNAHAAVRMPTEVLRRRADQLVSHLQLIQVAGGGGLQP